MNHIIGIEYKKPKNTDHYPFNLPVVKNLDTLEFNSPVTFFCGENGSGKSTMIEAIAVASGFNPEGGTKNFKFETRAQNKNRECVSELYKYLDIVKSTKITRRKRDGFFLRAESFYNVANEIERLDDIPGGGGKICWAYGDKPLHEISHGEAFFSLMTNRFFGNGLYILDEPEAALSVRRQYEMMFLIKKLVEDNSQFIISTHSPILLSYPNADIFAIDNGGIHRSAYEDTEQYGFMRDFINNYKAYTKYL